MISEKVRPELLGESAAAIRRPGRLVVALTAVAAIVAGCNVPPGPVRHTPAMRLGGRLERVARRADALGLTPGASHSTRPQTTGDVMRAFQPTVPQSTAEAIGAEELTPDEKWFGAYLQSYESEIEDQWDTSDANSYFIDPFFDSRLRVIAVDEKVKFYNEQGREFQKGLNFYVSNRSVARVADRVVLTADPEFSFVENDGVGDGQEDVNLRFQELTASVRLGPGQLTVGRQPLWWGPGRHGSLLLTNNARPFDLIKVSTAGPVLLPGFLEYLGLVQGELFVTQLENARAVPHPVLAGLRLSSRILPWIEIGGSRTAQFGGKGRPHNGRTVWNVITGSTENDKDDPGNQIASIDMRVIIPWAVQPFEVYGEFGGEDEAGGFFSRDAELAGLYLPRIGPWHALEFTFEWVDTTVPGHRRTWYTNRNFPDGYTFHGDIIGHHVGTDGQDFFFELRIHPPVLPERRVSIALSYDYEQHFRLDPVEERLHQFRATVEMLAWRKLAVSLFLQHDRWENFAQNRGRSDRGNAIGVGASWNF